MEIRGFEVDGGRALGCGGEDGIGGEGFWRVEAGFEGADFNVGVVGGRIDGKHEIHGSGDGRGPAKETAAIGVVDDEDSRPGEIGDTAQVEEDGLNRGDAVFCSVHQVGEGVDHDETDAEVDSAIGKHFGVVVVAEVVASEGSEVEGRTFVGVMALDGSVQARPELLEAGLFIHEKNGALEDRTTQPGFAHGNAEGKVDGHVGLLGAGVADEEVEAGT